MEMNVILGKQRADGTMTFALNIEGNCVQFDGEVGGSSIDVSWWMRGLPPFTTIKCKNLVDMMAMADYVADWIDKNADEIPTYREDCQ